MLVIDKEGVREVENGEQHGRVLYVDSYDYDYIKNSDNEKIVGQIFSKFGNCTIVNIGVSLGGGLYGHANVLRNEKTMKAQGGSFIFSDDVRKLLMKKLKYDCGSEII